MGVEKTQRKWVTNHHQGEKAQKNEKEENKGRGHQTMI